MGHVMFRKDDNIVIMKFFSYQFLNPQFFSYPQRHSHQEGSNTKWCVCKIGFQNSFEFQEWFIIERYVIDIFSGYTAIYKTIPDSINRETAVVFLSGVAFLLCGEDNLAVFYKTDSTIVVKCRYAKDIHSCFFW